MKKTKVKQVFNGIMYYLDDSEPTTKEKKNKNFKTKEKTDKSTVFNFDTSENCLCNNIMHMAEVKPGYVVKCDNNVYLIESVRYDVDFKGDTHIKGILLKHDQDRIFYGNKPIFLTKYTEYIECTLLCHTFEEFEIKWLLYGYYR